MTSDSIYHHNRSIVAASPRLFNVDTSRPAGLLALCPAYQVTPLGRLRTLEASLGISELWVKDETQRMGLGSFKALGGAYAIAQMVVDASGCKNPTDESARNTAAGMTFVTASAGNHGLSVAAGARVFGAAAVIVLAAAVPEGFADRIRAMGAEVIRVDGSYEDSVAHAIQAAEKNQWQLLADGSWPGYIEPPALVMEGYGVIAAETQATFAEQGEWPDTVFLQAGVGGLAAAMAAGIRVNWPVQPRIVVVEPDSAACLQRSVQHQQLTRAGGPESNMGRLDCKDASLIAFESLRQDADDFVTVSDQDAEQATALLAEHGIQTTPSGAAGLAGLKLIDPGLQSRCLIVVSEGREDG